MMEKIRGKLLPKVEIILKPAAFNKDGAIIGAVALGIALVLAGWLWPNYQHLQQEKLFLEQRKTQLAALEKFRSAKEDYAVRLQKLQSRQQQLNKLFREEGDCSDIVSLVQQQADKAGVLVKEISLPEKPKPWVKQKEKRYQPYSVKLLLAGEYLGLLQLIKSLEEEQLEMSQLHITAEQKGKKLLLAGRIDLYIVGNSNAKGKI